MKSFTSLASAAGIALFATSMFIGLAACDDSSSGPSSEPTSSESFLGSSDSDTPQLSSSSAGTSSATSPASSATLPASSAAKECFKAGMASITVRNMERKLISCPNSNTIYDYDLQILYTCEGSALIETDMAPCESDEP